MITAATLLFVSTLAADAFVSKVSFVAPPRIHVRHTASQLKVKAEEEIDFDAPLDRLMAVGDIVRTGEANSLPDHPIVVDDEVSPDYDPIHGAAVASSQKVHSGEETDFDAPMYRAKAVGDIVRTGEGTGLLDHEIVVDDECYMGKDGDFEDCVDFDPVRIPVQPKLKSDEQTDFDAPMYRAKAVGDIIRSGEGTGLLDHEIVVDDEESPDYDPLHGNGIPSSDARSTEATDFDAPMYRAKEVGDIVRTGEGTGLLDHEIVVDDECYHGKDGNFDDCVDFDPVRDPVQPKLKSGEETDFDAPMYRAKAVGDIVRTGETGTGLLDHEIVVDDECYNGKNGDFDDCVDFDPVRDPVQPKLRSGEETDFDAPMYRAKAVGDIVRTGEGTGLLDHEIVVDDEETPDFDPLHGNGIPSNSRSSEATDFDAPLYRQIAAGDIVRSGETMELDHDPIVDDECYMGKDGDYDDCVDFDPLP